MIILDQDKGRKILRVEVMAREKPLTGSGLEGGKTEIPLRITVNNEMDRSVTEVANTVKKDDG